MATVMNDGDFMPLVESVKSSRKNKYPSEKKADPLALQCFCCICLKGERESIQAEDSAKLPMNQRFESSQ